MAVEQTIKTPDELRQFFKDGDCWRSYGIQAMLVSEATGLPFSVVVPGLESGDFSLINAPDPRVLNTAKNRWNVFCGTYDTLKVQLGEMEQVAELLRR